MAVPQVPTLEQSPTTHGASAEDLAAMLGGAAPERISDSMALACSPSPAFMLRHHPEAWEVRTEGLDGPTWLPVLGPFQIVTGTHGIRTLRPGERAAEAYRDAVSKAQVHGGWTFLDPLEAIPSEFLPAGVPVGKGYLRSAPCRDIRSGQQGKVHLEAWNVPVATPPNRPQRFQFDAAKHNQWRAWLVETGRIQAPPSYVADDARAKVIRAKDRKQAMTDLPADLRAEGLERSNLKLDAIDEAVVPGDEPTATPAPKAPAAGKKAPAAGKKAPAAGKKAPALDAPPDGGAA